MPNSAGNAAALSEHREQEARPSTVANPRSTKGLARQIRERTADLQEQISEMIRISLDQTHKMQVTAIMWLADRAYGRVPEIAAFAELDESEARTAIKALTAPQLEALVASLVASTVAIPGAANTGKAA